MTFGRYDFPITATLAGPTGSASVPVADPRDRCPACGEPIAETPADPG